MFNKSNFCHIASNNRNEQKGSVFIYKTTDTLAQVTQSGYFNEKLIDINLHDLIIHVQYNSVNRTLKKSVLIVTERTLDNVATQPITDETILNDIGDLGEQVAAIEEKIPSDASSTNQLATQNDITDKITNCITEIPQNIKLELADGILTVKAGTKVYRPNGPNVFDEFILTSDRAFTDTSKTGKYLIAISPTNAILTGSVANSVSGTTAPTTGYTLWYDTTENIVYRYGATLSDPTANCSLPIAEVTMGNTGVVSIDRVFDDFGCIGSSYFRLPDITAFAPNGNNDDGTLNNTKIKTTNVVVNTLTGAGTRIITITNTSMVGWNTLTYDPITNYNYNSQGNIAIQPIVGTVTADSTGRIVDYYFKKPFHAVGYDDTEFIAHQAMPGNRYVDLTLPASGSTIAAPADGYITLTKTAGASGEYAYMRNTVNGVNSGIMATAALNCRIFIPVSKGHTVSINYTLSGSTSDFRFVYANGAK